MTPLTPIPSAVENVRVVFTMMLSLSDSAAPTRLPTAPFTSQRWWFNMESRVKSSKRDSCALLVAKGDPTRGKAPIAKDDESIAAARRDAKTVSFPCIWFT